jgi:hypothetical protein
MLKRYYLRAYFIVCKGFKHECRAPYIPAVSVCPSIRYQRRRHIVPIVNIRILHGSIQSGFILYTIKIKI